MIEGGCFCGAIGYAIDDGDYLVANCHCSICRRTSGAPFVTWMIVSRAAFSYTRGRPAVLHSSDRGTRYFCQACGTPLAFQSSSRKDEIDITTGSLVNPGDYPPVLAVFEDTKLPWLTETEVRSARSRPVQPRRPDKPGRSDDASGSS